MSTYTQLYYHIVFAPKHREPVLLKPAQTRLFSYLWKVLENKKCHPYAINGVEDHVHIFTHVHQTISVAQLVKDLKLASSDFIKRERVFPGFAAWQEGYAVFTKSHEDKDGIIKYVKNQEEHHRNESYLDELKRLLREAGIEFDQRYLD